MFLAWKAAWPPQRCIACSQLSLSSLTLHRTRMSIRPHIRILHRTHASRTRHRPRYYHTDTRTRVLTHRPAGLRICTGTHTLAGTGPTQFSLSSSSAARSHGLPGVAARLSWAAREKGRVSFDEVACDALLRAWAITARTAAARNIATRRNPNRRDQG